MTTQTGDGWKLWPTEQEIAPVSHRPWHHADTFLSFMYLFTAVSCTFVHAHNSVCLRIDLVLELRAHLRLFTGDLQGIDIGY